VFLSEEGCALGAVCTATAPFPPSHLVFPPNRTQPPPNPHLTPPDHIRVNWKLTSIAHDAASGLYTLRYDTPAGPTEVRSRSVAMTMPAWALADLIRAQAPAAADALGAFDYPPVAAVTLAYPESAIREDRRAADGSVPGFGQLHPRTQGVTTLGTIYSSSLFPGRCPKGEMLLLNYIGGATNRGVKDASHEDLAAQVCV